MKFPATTFNIFYFELNMSWMGWHKFWLTLCPLMPGRPGVPGKPRAPWEKKPKKQGGDKSYYLSSVFVLHIGGKNQQLTWGPEGPRSPGRPGLPDSPWEKESWGDGDEMMAQDIPQSKLIYICRWTDMISIQCTYILAVLSRGAGSSTGTHGTLKRKSNIRWEC